MLMTLLLLGLAMQNNAVVESNNNVLAIYPSNPHYFQNGDGQPILLIGDSASTTFADVDYGFKTMFDTLKANDINLSRVWVFWGCETLIGNLNRVMVIPYLRTGPGDANDGKSKYDLSQFNPDFFERLRNVCISAREHGIFLQLILFDAWLLKHPFLWINHAYQRNNNINGVDGDPENTGTGIDGQKGFCSLENTKVLEYQKAFVRKTIDTVNEFDNIFYEIANENYYNADWEISLCQFIHEYEKGKPKQHLVMPLDLINHDYDGIKTWDIQELHTNLLMAQALKHPLIFDTDGIGCPDDTTVRKGAWTAFASGGNIDYWDSSFKIDLVGSQFATMRQQLKYLATFIKHIKFWEMQPTDSLVNTGKAFTIASKNEIVSYLPDGGKIVLDLASVKGVLSAQWFNTRNGVFDKEFQVNGGELIGFNAPDDNDWALLIVNR